MAVKDCEKCGGSGYYKPAIFKEALINCDLCNVDMRPIRKPKRAAGPSGRGG